MNDRFQNEERTIEEALEDLAAPGAWSDGTAEAGVGEVDETLRRLYSETLGLLAYEAEPIAPSAGAKDRLLAALANAGDAGDAPVAEPAATTDDDEDSSVVVTFGARGEGEPAASVASIASEPAPAAAPAPVHAWAHWASLLAAIFAVMAVGLAVFLWRELDRSRESLARLEQEQQQLVAQLSAETQAQRLLAAQSGRLGNLVSVVSTPGVEICPMRPVGDSPLAPGSFAVLYMPPGQESWYLVVSNLKPAAQGVYKVWLTTADGIVPAGAIDMSDQVDGRVTVRIPPGVLEDGDVLGGRMRSATVTLEPAAGAEAPSGPTVLFGNTKMQVL